jgi:hypothetical protein
MILIQIARERRVGALAKVRVDGRIRVLANEIAVA